MRVNDGCELSLMNSFLKKSYVCYYDIKTQIISLSSIATLCEGDNWNTWKMDNYHQLELVGEGSFGKVYKGRRKFSSQVSKQSVELLLTS